METIDIPKIIEIFNQYKYASRGELKKDINNIYNILCKDIPIVYPYNEVINNKHRDVIKMFTSGSSVDDISKVIGYTKANVRSILKKQGLYHGEEKSKNNFLFYKIRNIKLFYNIIVNGKYDDNPCKRRQQEIVRKFLDYYFNGRKHVVENLLIHLNDNEKKDLLNTLDNLPTNS